MTPLEVPLKLVVDLVRLSSGVLINATSRLPVKTQCHFACDIYSGLSAHCRLKVFSFRPLNSIELLLYAKENAFKCEMLGWALCDFFVSLLSCSLQFGLEVESRCYVRAMNRKQVFDGQNTPLTSVDAKEFVRV